MLTPPQTLVPSIWISTASMSWKCSATWLKGTRKHTWPYRDVWIQPYLQRFHTFDSRCEPGFMDNLDRLLTAMTNYAMIIGIDCVEREELAKRSCNELKISIVKYEWQIKTMYSKKLTVTHWIGHKSMNPLMIGHKRKHTMGKHQFLNAHFPDSVLVNTVGQLNKPETSDKLGEWFKNP